MDERDKVSAPCNERQQQQRHNHLELNRLSDSHGVDVPELTDGLSPTVRAYSRISMFWNLMRIVFFFFLRSSVPYLLCKLSSMVDTLMMPLMRRHVNGAVLGVDLDLNNRGGLKARVGLIGGPELRIPLVLSSADLRRGGIYLSLIVWCWIR